jgi:hypothetical protein
VVESTRAKAAREGKAGKLRVASARPCSAAGDLDDAIIAVRAVRGALRTEKETALEALKYTSKKKGGVVTKAYTDAMARHNTNHQKYWYGTLIGPDCRRCLEHYEEILLLVKTAITENEGVGIGEPMATAFYNRHCAVLEKLAQCTHAERNFRVEGGAQAMPCGIIGCLSQTQVPDRQSPPHRATLGFSGKYGTLGVFGEDGIGSFYPWVNRYRVPTGLICNDH